MAVLEQMRCCLPRSQAVDGIHKYAMLLCHLQQAIAVHQLASDTAESKTPPLCNKYKYV